MSGTGKSAVLAELQRRGHRVVDTDYGDWIDASGTEPLWREERIAELLDGHSEGLLFVGGCVANQGRFYPRLDAVVLLSAPKEVILERVATRESNEFGKSDMSASRSAAISRRRSHCFAPARRTDRHESSAQGSGGRVERIGGTVSSLKTSDPGAESRCRHRAIPDKSE